MFGSINWVLVHKTADKIYGKERVWLDSCLQNYNRASFFLFLIFLSGYFMYEIHILVQQKKRIDAVLAENTEFSRSFIQELIKKGMIRVSNIVVKSQAQKVFGDIWVTINDGAESFLEVKAHEPQNIPLDILFEDEDIIVINKQSGLVCHPSCGHSDNTLVNALLFHCGQRLSDVSGRGRLGIVHRLDKDTSGVLIVAKNNLAHVSIAEQFANCKGVSLHRKYLCFVYGRPKEASSVIDTFIGRHRYFRQRNAVLQHGGRRAITNYKIEKTIFISDRTAISKIDCELLSGRTHQIRVHMQYIGCPIVGDPVYCPKRPISSGLPDCLKTLSRQALHAYEIAFCHPKTRELLIFSAPLPSDLQEINKLFESIVGQSS
jgi:23S rRNA pseudouridine1911/1915/1917 synthase